MIRRPPRSTLSSSSAASDVYKRQSEYIVAASLTANIRPTALSRARHRVLRLRQRSGTSLLFAHPLHEQRLKLFLSVDTFADQQSVHRINGRFERFIS